MKSETMLKKDYILQAMELNKSDYLKFIDAIKKARKDITELEVLAIFNRNIKLKSKKEICTLLEKTIEEIRCVQEKLLEDEAIEV